MGCCTIGEEKERTNVVDEGWLSVGNGRNGLMSVSAIAEMFDITMCVLLCMTFSCVKFFTRRVAKRLH